MNTAEFARNSILALVLLIGPVSAAEPEVRSLSAGAAAAPATLADFEGLIGDWAGALGVASFSAPLGGQIVGHLALLNDDTSYKIEEIWILRQEGDHVAVRQKHYTPDLKDREEANQWTVRPVVAIDRGHIYLNNLTWVTDGDNLQLGVRLPAGNGAPGVHLAFSFKRVK